MKFIEVTQGCITVGVAQTIDLNISTSNAGNKSDVAISGDIPGKVSCDNSLYPDVIISDAILDTFIKPIYKDTGTEVLCGLVCGVDLGLPVLYASDGVLITIDGQYLIVQKES